MKFKIIYLIVFALALLFSYFEFGQDDKPGSNPKPPSQSDDSLVIH